MLLLTCEYHLFPEDGGEAKISGRVIDMERDHLAFAVIIVADGLSLTRQRWLFEIVDKAHAATDYETKKEGDTEFSFSAGYGRNRFTSYHDTSDEAIAFLQSALLWISRATRERNTPRG